jgi:hypothetical protein
MQNANQSLITLGEAKLAIQAAISVGYDTQALGLMAVAVALIGVNVALLDNLGAVWWLPTVALGGALFTSIAAISQPEIDTGQDITPSLLMEATDEQTNGLVLTSIAQAIDYNTEALQDKRGLVTVATVLIGLSFALVGIAQLLPSCWDAIRGLAG